jgi:hypothetical protein
VSLPMFFFQGQCLGGFGKVNDNLSVFIRSMEEEQVARSAFSLHCPHPGPVWLTYGVTWRRTWLADVHVYQACQDRAAGRGGC